MQAVFKHGNPDFIPLTPTSDVGAGDVVVLGNIPCIAHNDVAANVPGSFAIGRGVYLVYSEENIVAGTRIWFNTQDHKVSKDVGSTSGEPHFGFTVEDLVAGTHGLCMHCPDGTLSS